MVRLWKAFSHSYNSSIIISQVPFYREVLRLRGSISRDMPWEVMPDLFFYRDPEEAEKEEAARAEEVMANMFVSNV